MSPPLPVDWSRRVYQHLRSCTVLNLAMSSRLVSYTVVAIPWRFLAHLVASLTCFSRSSPVPAVRFLICSLAGGSQLCYAHAACFVATHVKSAASPCTALPCLSTANRVASVQLRSVSGRVKSPRRNSNPDLLVWYRVASPPCRCESCHVQSKRLRSVAMRIVSRPFAALSPTFMSVRRSATSSQFFYAHRRCAASLCPVLPCRSLPLRFASAHRRSVHCQFRSKPCRTVQCLNDSWHVASQPITSTPVQSNSSPFSSFSYHLESTHILCLSTHLPSAPFMAMPSLCRYAHGSSVPKRHTFLRFSSVPVQVFSARFSSEPMRFSSPYGVSDLFTACAVRSLSPPLAALPDLLLSAPGPASPCHCAASRVRARPFLIASLRFGSLPYHIASKLICSIPAPCVSSACHAGAAPSRACPLFAISPPLLSLLLPAGALLVSSNQYPSLPMQIHSVHSLSEASIFESVRCVAAPWPCEARRRSAAPVLIKSGLRTSYARQANRRGSQPRRSTYAVALRSAGRSPSMTLPFSSSSSQ